MSVCLWYRVDPYSPCVPTCLFTVAVSLLLLPAPITAASMSTAPSIPAHELKMVLAWALDSCASRDVSRPVPEDAVVWHQSVKAEKNPEEATATLLRLMRNEIHGSMDTTTTTIMTTTTTTPIIPIIPINNNIHQEEKNHPLPPPAETAATSPSIP